MNTKRKRFWLGFAAVLAAMTAFAAPGYAQWSRVGNVNVTTAAHNTRPPAEVASGDGLVHVAYVDNYTLKCSTYNGSSWSTANIETFPSSNPILAKVHDISIATNSDGDVSIVYAWSKATYYPVSPAEKTEHYLKIIIGTNNSGTISWGGLDSLHNDIVSTDYAAMPYKYNLEDLLNNHSFDEDGGVPFFAAISHGYDSGDNRCTAIAYGWRDCVVGDETAYEWYAVEVFDHSWSQIPDASNEFIDNASCGDYTDHPYDPCDECAVTPSQDMQPVTRKYLDIDLATSGTDILVLYAKTSGLKYARYNGSSWTTTQLSGSIFHRVAIDTFHDGTAWRSFVGAAIQDLSEESDWDIQWAKFSASSPPTAMGGTIHNANLGDVVVTGGAPDAFLTTEVYDSGDELWQVYATEWDYTGSPTGNGLSAYRASRSYTTPDNYSNAVWRSFMAPRTSDSPYVLQSQDASTGYLLRE